MTTITTQPIPTAPASRPHQPVQNVPNPDSFEPGEREVAISYKSVLGLFQQPTECLRLEKLPDIPAPGRSSFGVARSGDKIYIVGGHQGREHTYPRESFLDRLECYDTTTGEWTTLAPRPVEAHGYDVVADGPYVYAFGGFAYSDDHNPNWKSLSDVHRYDTRTDAWEKVGDLSRPRSSNVVVQVGRNVYMMGGWDSTPQSEGDKEGEFLSSVEVMNLDSGELTTASYTIPDPVRRAFTAVELDGEVIMLGGLGEGSTHFEMLDKVTAVNPVTGESRELPPLPFPTFAPGAGQLDGTLYVFGGLVRDGEESYHYVDTVYKLEPGADEWVDAGVRLSENKGFPMVVEMENGELGILGGHSYDDGDAPVATFEVLKQGECEKRGCFPF